MEFSVKYCKSMQNTENGKFILKSKRTAWRYWFYIMLIMVTVQCTGVNIKLKLSTLHLANTTNQLIAMCQPGNLLYCPWADVALSLLPRDNTNPLHNITCVYQLATHVSTIIYSYQIPMNLLFTVIIVWHGDLSEIQSLYLILGYMRRHYRLWSGFSTCTCACISVE